MKAAWIATLLMGTAGVLGWAQTAAARRFPLTVEKIARTFSDRGVSISGDQISMLANVVASEENPMLDVLSVQQLGGRWAEGRTENHSLVKLACRVPGTCLPFYVIVNAQEAPARSTGSEAKLMPASLSVRIAPSAPITIRAGTHATLIMDDSRAHIQVTVISLESGHTGDKIHVATPDHKQTYLAEVMSANLLRRSF
jgi:hypothetical protein